MDEKACVLPRLNRVNSQTNVLLRRSSSEISLLDLYRKIAVNNFDKASFSVMDDKNSLSLLLSLSQQALINFRENIGYSIKYFIFYMF